MRGSEPRRWENDSVKASIFVGTSLDGFIARPNGTFDFLSAGHADAEPHGFDEFLATVDALVMGRNTFETVLPFPIWPYGNKPVFVLSSRPLPPAPSGATVERMTGTPAEVLAQLAGRGMGHVYVDGGVTIQAFLRAGLIQHLVISRVPVLIGAGIPLFGVVDADIPLKHIATRQYSSGLVQSEYAIEQGEAD
jgi:dihydrofolate reductase